MSSNRSRRLAFGLTCLALAVLAAGCATDAHKPASQAQAITPTEQFPLTARETPGELRLAAHAAGLSAAQRDALAALADRWLQEGGDAVTIRAPTSGADPRAAYETSAQAAALLRALGVPDEQIHRVGYEPAGAGPAPVVVAYSTYRAEIPRCGLKWENLSTNRKNQPMSNFGCAVSANLAAQIADPADIAAPRALAPTDAGRRTTILDKYRQGQLTSGAADSAASGAVSSIGASGGGGGSQ